MVSYSAYTARIANDVSRQQFAEKYLKPLLREMRKTGVISPEYLPYKALKKIADKPEA